jgi:hypothetical protein
MSIFKRKPGGTLFGNLFRAATAALMPYGTGALINRYINPAPAKRIETSNDGDDANYI